MRKKFIYYTIICMLVFIVVAGSTHVEDATNSDTLYDNLDMSAPVSDIEVSPESELSEEPQQSLERDKLEEWIGIYEYGEGFSSREFCEYKISIYENNGYYHADMLVNGWMTGMNAMLEVYGDNKSLELVFQEYSGDLPPTNNMSIFEEGDVLLRFSYEDGDIITYWDKLTPIAAFYLDDANGICFVKQEENSNIPSYTSFPDDPMEAYEAYLNGKIPALVEGKDNYIWWLFEFGDQEYQSYDQYALFDMNGDGIPELHIRDRIGYGILTYRNGSVLLWYSEANYSWPLDNGAVLYTRNGGGPNHISYRYRVLDFEGEIVQSINFSKWDGNQNLVYDEDDLYIFEDDELTMQVWEERTAEYLSITANKIIWHQMEEDICLLEHIE